MASRKGALRFYEDAVHNSHPPPAPPPWLGMKGVPTMLPHKPLHEAQLAWYRGAPLHQSYRGLLDRDAIARRVPLKHLRTTPRALWGSVTTVI